MPNLTFADVRVTQIAPDDHSWHARCDLETLAEFFVNPAGWMQALTLKAQDDGQIQNDMVLEIANQYTVLVNPLLQTEYDVLRSAPLDNLDAFKVYAAFAFPEDLSNPMVVVSGINRTSYVRVDRSLIAASSAFRARPEWAAYWDALVATGSELTILADDGLVYGHRQISAANDPEAGQKLAAFLILASTSPAHASALLQTNFTTRRVVTDNEVLRGNLQAAALTFAPLTEQTFLSATFSVSGEIGTDGAACEVDRGRLVNGEIIYLGSDSKVYKAPTHPRPAPEAFAADTGLETPADDLGRTFMAAPFRRGGLDTTVNIGRFNATIDDGFGLRILASGSSPADPINDKRIFEARDSLLRAGKQDGSPITVFGWRRGTQHFTMESFA